MEEAKGAEKITAAEATEKLPGHGIFRQESLERISSPEELNDYIRVANPSMWIIVAAVVLLLAALFVWSAFGTLETTIPDAFYVENGTASCYLSDASDVSVGDAVRFGAAEGTVTAVSASPYSSREISARYHDDYTLHILGIEDWNYEVTVSVPAQPDGLAEGTIITGVVKPASFIFN